MIVIEQSKSNDKLSKFEFRWNDWSKNESQLPSLDAYAQTKSREKVDEKRWENIKRNSNVAIS